MDIDDLYALPGASPDRIAIALTTASPITPAQAAAGFAFDPNLLTTFPYLAAPTQ